MKNEGIEFKLTNIYLEELTLNKIEKDDSFLYNKDDKGKQKGAQTIELSGKILYGQDKKLIRYIFGCEFIEKGNFEISIIYDTYFIIKGNDIEFIQQKHSEDELINMFNRNIWPYVVEQINSLTAKMDIDKKIILPSYGVIIDEH